MEQQSGLPTFDELEARFDAASENRIPHYNWIPPKWKDLFSASDPDDPGKRGERFFADNCANVGRFDLNDAKVKPQIQLLKKAFAGMRKDPKLPSPFDDFAHLDPEQLSDDDIKALAGGTKPAAALKKLRNLAGSQSPGMTRLEKVFKWILVSFHDLCGDLNDALKNPRGEAEYEKLRKLYIERLRDLDDHEPQTKSQGRDGKDLLPIGPGSRGYGRIIKWVYVAPVIVNGSIIGLRVIVHWNPHSSSSGVPILHP
jgi:hypothetical protein